MAIFVDSHQPPVLAIPQPVYVSPLYAGGSRPNPEAVIIPRDYSVLGPRMLAIPAPPYVHPIHIPVQKGAIQLQPGLLQEPILVEKYQPPMTLPVFK
ncbi:MAG: hypothetical protein NVS1B6_08630 [Steroidobacteraceae bacterium]